MVCMEILQQAFRGVPHETRYEGRDSTTRNLKTYEKYTGNPTKYKNSSAYLARQRQRYRVRYGPRSTFRTGGFDALARQLCIHLAAHGGSHRRNGQLQRCPGS